MKQQPLGLRDYLPDDIRRRDALIKKMSQVALDNDYDRIITPVIESYDALQPGLGTLADDCISFFDGGGSRLVLRPDHTTPIARIVGSRLTQDLPVRLFYHDPVFRNDPLLGETEIFQWGVEHIGHLTIQDEIAMIQMAVATCSAIGLDDIEVHVAHPALFKDHSVIHCEALARGDFSALNELPACIQSKNLEDNNPLYPLVSQLHSNGITNVVVNFGLYKDLTYYNGAYFDIVSRSFGKVIGSGGRYDAVLNAFNVSAHAVGFAFRLHYIERALAL